jgi:hypothetical protein
VAGRVLVEASVWPVVVEVVYVLVEDGAGVFFVVDQHSVGAFLADAGTTTQAVSARRNSPQLGKRPSRLKPLRQSRKTEQEPPPPPDMRLRSRDRLSGLIHEYAQAA